MDAAYQTYKREGFFGFYRGLIPSLAKVVPAVSRDVFLIRDATRELVSNKGDAVLIRVLVARPAYFAGFRRRVPARHGFLPDVPQGGIVHA